MYLDLNQTGLASKVCTPPTRWKLKLGGFGGINLIPTKRADYIARTSGKTHFSVARHRHQRGRQRTAEQRYRPKAGFPAQAGRYIVGDPGPGGMGLVERLQPDACSISKPG